MGELTERYGCASWFAGDSPLVIGASWRELKRAQRGACYLCGRIVSNRRMSYDHVTPKALGGGNLGNKLLAHKDCNGRKGSRQAYPCELLYLAQVNTEIAARRKRLGRPS